VQNEAPSTNSTTEPANSAARDPSSAGEEGESAAARAKTEILTAAPIQISDVPRIHAGIFLGTEGQRYHGKTRNLTHSKAASSC
jgi:hypothetical protein